MGKVKNIEHIGRYERCVLKVKYNQPKICEKKKWRGTYKSSGKRKNCYNPWAICTKSVGRPVSRRTKMK